MKRLQEEALKAAIQTSKIVLIQGPKNVGKEDLCIHLLRELDTPFALLNGRDKEWEANDLNAIAEGTLVFNDAQHIPNLQGILEATLEGQIQKNLVLLCSFRPVLDDILLEVLETNGMLFSFFAPSFYEAAQHFGIAEESIVVISGANTGLSSDLAMACCRYFRILPEGNTITQSSKLRLSSFRCAAISSINFIGYFLLR